MNRLQISIRVNPTKSDPRNFKRCQSRRIETLRAPNQGLGRDVPNHDSRKGFEPPGWIGMAHRPKKLTYFSLKIICRI